MLNNTLSKIKIKNLISLLIEVLLFSNVWIFLYRRILFFLNLYRPVELPKGFIYVGAVPEPYEIPLYILLMIVFSISIFMYYRFVKPKIVNNNIQPFSSLNFLIQAVCVLVLLTIFWVNIGSYPLWDFNGLNSGEGSKFPVSSILLSFLGLTLFITAQLGILGQIIDFSKKRSAIILYSIITGIIMLFTFEPHFPISAIDYAYFLGPIFDINSGKTIFTQITSQYGFLSILFLALLRFLNLFSIGSLPFIIWFFFIVEYFVVFYLVFKVSKSAVLAMISLFSVLIINNYSNVTLPLALPQTGAMRFLPLIFSMVLLLKIRNINSKIFIYIVSILSLWIIDAGIYLIAAYCLTILLLFLAGEIRLKEMLLSGLSLFTFFIGNLLIINLFHWFLGFRLIDYGLMLFKISQYSKAGFSMVPIPSHTYFWLIILLYFLSLSVLFRKEVPALIRYLLLFSANLTLFSSIYYVGRSIDPNLFTISPMPIVTIFLLVSAYYPKVTLKENKLAILTGLFIIMIIIPAFGRQKGLAENFGQKYHQLIKKNIFQSEINNDLNLLYAKDLNFIRNNIPEKKIAILSLDDTYLYYATNKLNPINSNPQAGIVTYDELQFAVKDFLCGQRILVDCLVFNSCKPYTKLSSYSNLVQTEILKAIENKCKTKYQKKECIDKLCIADD